MLMLFAINIKISLCLSKLQFTKAGAFLLRHSVYACQLFAIALLQFIANLMHRMSLYSCCIVLCTK